MSPVRQHDSIDLTKEIQTREASVYSVYPTVCIIIDIISSQGLLENHCYRQDLVPLLQPSIHRCHSIFFDLGHKYAVVIQNIRQVHTSNNVEPQT